jgi:protoporphyrinogen oxidase
MDILKNIPPWRLARALLGLAVQTLRNKLYRHGPADAEEALIRLYGRPLYEYFFRDFTHRYWGIPASALSATFVRTKMPRLSAVDAVKKTLARLGLHMKEQAVESALSKETVWYTPTGARELPQTLARFVEEHGGQVLLGASVAAVETDNDRVSAVGYDLGGERFTVPCSQVITTMPVTEFVRSFVPQPRDAVLDACDQLNYKPIAIYGLLVRRPKVLDALYIYFRGRVFHRVAEPKNSGLRVAPEDWTILIVEMTCDEGDDRWQGGEETRRAILRDLEEEGLVRAEDVAETHLLRTPYGYPIFKLGFERYHEELKGFLRRFENVQSVGRQGGFCYPNMHSAMRMGAEAARRVVEALGRTIPARQQAEQRAQR